ncbi:MAG: hypothetical protein JWM68_183 [Verrucomicrobiales bacterium]|nr:hypothetical protein [Verrucomicrobiales bacterium]
MKASAVLLLFLSTSVFGELSPLYEKRKDHDPDGIGIFYMGREIAHVMGHQGADWLERPEREEEERTEQMVDALNLKPGEIVADIGAGTGYISRKLSKRVGDKGSVLAVEIQQEMLDILTNKAVAAGVHNIKPVLGTITDPKLGSEAVDAVLMVDVYHEFDHPYEMLMSIGKSLKPGGRVIFVEYRAEDPNVPIKRVHKMAEQQVKYEASVHPLVWKETIETLPRQHIIIFEKPIGVDFAKAKGLPSLEEVLASKDDLWGEAAMRQTNGPTYKFFKDLLPPLRYCNAAFKHYPIVLSAPGATNKARLVSNGSAVNARSVLKHVWREVGIPVTFTVGNDKELFGSDLKKLQGPKYEKGYLPIVQMEYEHGGSVYSEEVFASTDRLFAERGLVFVRFKGEGEKAGVISAKTGEGNLTFAEKAVRDTNGYAWVYSDDKWKWDGATETLTATLGKGEVATLAIATLPIAQPVSMFGFPSYQQQRKSCIYTWESILAGGVQIETPEPYVNNAWRSLVIGALVLQKGAAPNYSAGNQYERLYEAESGDVARAAVLFGQEEEGKKMVVPCLDYARKGLFFHQAAFKLQLLAHYYWLTRDAKFVREMEPRWSKEVQRIIEGREKESGLLPKEQYAGDIFEDVHTLNSNANGSKGLRDMAAVLLDIGETNEATRISNAGNELRKATLAAVEKSIFANTKPPFIPLALFGYEKPYERITDSKLGSYWNEMAPYVLCSDVFGLGSERETQLLNYQYEHGGIAMGMVRFHQHSGLYGNESGVDDLYTLRHTEKLLQRDEVDRALVSFYGKLAQGLTPDTFIGCEGSSLRSFDEFGRPMYLPPNSTSDAFFLWTLRGLLVQDIDSDDDCKPDTLRLLFATPKHWLEEGKQIRVQHAPTAFGDVSVQVISKLKQDKVLVEVDLPQRSQPKKILMRARVPEGWKVVSARIHDKQVAVDAKGTVDLSGLKGHQTIWFRSVKK